jgi:hypothetical protein
VRGTHALLPVENPLAGGLENICQMRQKSGTSLTSGIVLHAEEHKPEFFEPDCASGPCASMCTRFESGRFKFEWTGTRGKPDFPGFLKKFLREFMQHFCPKFSLKTVPLIIINQGLLMKLLFRIHGVDSGNGCFWNSAFKDTIAALK